MNSAGKLLAGLLALAFGAGSFAADFPVRPIRVIIPFAAGGAVDQLLRPLQGVLGENLGQSVIYDNRAGAGGMIGTQAVATAPADGYTVLAVTSSFAVNPSLQANLPYDSRKDFTAVSVLASQPNILVVNPKVPAKDLRELIALAKARPGSLNFASGGNGSSPHLTGELFKQLTGTQITHVPFKGTAPAMLEVLGGRVEILFAGPLAIDGPLKDGKLRAIAVASDRRSPLLPNVPTTKEAGLEGLETGSWFAILAHSGTPANIVARLNSAFTQALQRPDTKARLGAQGVDIIADSPQRSTAFVHAEIDRWGKVIKDANVKIQ